MSLEVYNRKDYSELAKKYSKAFADFRKRERELRKEIFGDLDKEKRLIESDLEKEFNELWNLYGTKGYNLDKFKIRIEMFSGHHYSEIMCLTTPEGTFDLESIAKNYPPEERTPYQLRDRNKKYLENENKIKEGLEKIGFSDFSFHEKIKDFYQHHGILPIDVIYFERE